MGLTLAIPEPRLCTDNGAMIAAAGALLPPDAEPWIQNADADLKLGADMDVTREDVLRCAALAHLSLREEEIEPMRVAMTRMLTHAASLDELALDEVEPMLAGLDRPCPGGRMSHMTPSPRPRPWRMRRSRIGGTSWCPRCCSRN